MSGAEAADEEVGEPESDPEVVGATAVSEPEPEDAVELDAGLVRQVEEPS